MALDASAWHSALGDGLEPCPGVDLYIKLPHATETGDGLLPYGEFWFGLLGLLS